MDLNVTQVVLDYLAVRPLVLLCYKVNTLALIFLVAGKGERYAEGDEASPAGFFSSVGAPAKLSG